MLGKGEFFTHCNQPKPSDYVGYIPRLNASAIERLEEMGVKSVHEIPADFELSEIQRRACTAVQTGQPWFSADLKTEFEFLKYPLYFMDFETINPAIPRFLGMRPYDHLPFQWSVHGQSQRGAVAEHFEFLAIDGGDPRKAFIASLCEALGESRTVVVYNQQFESQRLWESTAFLARKLKQQSSTALALHVSSTASPGDHWFCRLVGTQRYGR